jgi:hypothetical protein
MKNQFIPTFRFLGSENGQATPKWQFQTTIIHLWINPRCTRQIFRQTQFSRTDFGSFLPVILQYFFGKLAESCSPGTQCIIQPLRNEDIMISGMFGHRGRILPPKSHLRWCSGDVVAIHPDTCNTICGCIVNRNGLISLSSWLNQLFHLKQTCSAWYTRFTNQGLDLLMG